MAIYIIATGYNKNAPLNTVELSLTSIDSLWDYGTMWEYLQLKTSDGRPRADDGHNGKVLKAAAVMAVALSTSFKANSRATAITHSSGGGSNHYSFMCTLSEHNCNEELECNRIHVPGLVSSKPQKGSDPRHESPMHSAKVLQGSNITQGPRHPVRSHALGQ
ncbi:hypothetical protein EI94DRAFT_1702382 [Lactarius quietus]|nr:hypothetical protein EI94DRAFT_1702382 [Lactarius quietus]